MEEQTITVTPRIDALLDQRSTPDARVVAAYYRQANGWLALDAALIARCPGGEKHGAALAILATTVDRMGARYIAALLGLEVPRDAVPSEPKQEEPNAAP